MFLSIFDFGNEMTQININVKCAICGKKDIRKFPGGVIPVCLSEYEAKTFGLPRDIEEFKKKCNDKIIKNNVYSAVQDYWEGRSVRPYSIKTI